ncbi:MAG: endonuclease/exonuclease/phosphatase family protein, partial [Bacteroidota bacterium]
MKVSKYLFIHLGIITILGCTDLSLFEKEESLVITSNFENPTTFSSELTIMAWNIQMGFRNGERAFSGEPNLNEEPHFDSLANIIKTSGADVVLLQEVGYELNNTQIKYQLEHLSNILKMNYIYADYSEINTGKNIFVNGKRGHGILTNLAVDTFFKTETLYKGRFNRRNMLTAKIEYQKNRYLYFTSVHLDSRSSRLEIESQFDQITLLPNDYPRVIG